MSLCDQCLLSGLKVTKITDVRHEDSKKKKKKKRELRWSERREKTVQKRSRQWNQIKILEDN